MDLAWLSLLALAAVVAISCTTRANPGIVAIVLAWALAVHVAPLLGQPLGLKALKDGFPAELFLTLLGVSLLFTQAETNGTLGRVAAGALGLCRGSAGLIPVLFFLLAAGLGTAGPGNIAVAGLLAPVAMAAAQRAGIPPLLMAVMVGHGAIASTLSPFTAAGVVANNILAGMGLEGHAWLVYGYNALANAAVAMAGFLLFGGWRLLRRRQPDLGPLAPQEDTPCAERTGQGHVPTAESPALAPRHWATLAVVAALVLGVVSGVVHIGLGAFAGAAVLSIFRLADERETFQKLPWSVIVMVCGVSLLTALLEQTGGTQRLADLVARVSTPGTLPGVLAFVTGVVSIYSSTTGVVLPAFLPMVKDLAAAQSGSDPLALSLAVLIGGNLVDMSPLSTIGALCVAGAPAGVDRTRLFNQLLAWGFALAAVAGIFCWLWL